MKAKFIGKLYDKYSARVTLEYEYRGYRYFVEDEHNGCMSSMAEKHQYEQKRIDQRIEQANQEPKPYSGLTMDELYAIMNWP